MMDKNLELVKDDLFGVVKRIKQIDPKYFVVFNHKTKNYEVHNERQPEGNTLALVCPYGGLDLRVVRLVRQTRCERANEVFREIEDNNEKIEKHNAEVITDNAKQRAKEIIARHLANRN